MHFTALRDGATVAIMTVRKPPMHAMDWLSGLAKAHLAENRDRVEYLSSSAVLVVVRWVKSFPMRVV